jgi:hypothetical protein
MAAVRTAGPRLYQRECSREDIVWNTALSTATDNAIWPRTYRALSGGSSRRSSRLSAAPRKAITAATPGWYTSAAESSIGKLRLNAISEDPLTGNRSTIAIAVAHTRIFQSVNSLRFVMYRAPNQRKSGPTIRSSKARSLPSRLVLVVRSPIRDALRQPGPL